MGKLLVVIDMQNDFINGALGTKEAIEIVPKVCEKIKNFDGEIVFTLDTHFDDYLNTQEGKNLPVKHCIKGTKGHNLNDEVKSAIKNKIQCAKKFDKINSFGCLELANYIKDKNYDSIEFIGLCTDICVITNALMVKSVATQTPIIVDSSCCAGVTKETHENALNAMKICQINII